MFIIKALARLHPNKPSPALPVIAGYYSNLVEKNYIVTSSQALPYIRLL